MVRPLITLCALLGYLAGQMAALPHGHADGNPPGHSSAPHVHLSWLTGKSPAHDHEHDHGYHHGHRHRSADKAKPHMPSVSCSYDHDADAFYFAGGSIGTARRDGSKLQWQEAHPAHSFLMCGSDATFDGTGHGFSVPPHPPDGGPIGCALYLQLRTLRI